MNSISEIVNEIFNIFISSSVSIRSLMKNFGHYFFFPLGILVTYLCVCMYVYIEYIILYMFYILYIRVFELFYSSLMICSLKVDMVFFLCLSCLHLPCMLFPLAFEYMDTIIITVLIFLCVNSIIYESSRFSLIGFSPLYGLHLPTSLRSGNFRWMPDILNFTLLDALYSYKYF